MPENGAGWSETPAAIRDHANDLAMESVLLHRLAVLRSGEWRELGFASFDAWAATKNDKHRIALSVPERRELIAELAAEGVPVADQAAALGVGQRTVKNDRRAVLPPKPKKPQIVDPSWGSVAPDIDAAAPILDPAPEPAPEQREAVSRAARKALDAELKASKAAAELDKIAHEWSLASARLTQASAAVRAALKADPSGELTRAALTRRRSNDVADTHADLVRALLDELTELAAITTDRITTPSLRRIK